MAVLRFPELSFSSILKVNFLGVHSYTKTGFLVYSRFASCMIIRFGRCALCNTLCCVTPTAPRRKADGGHERDKGEEGRERVMRRSE
jgi:hypothetical protein